MSDNARFHNKLHRKNHHSSPTAGYPDSATDPIASAAEPFQGDFYLAGNLNVTGALNTVFNTLSNINIPTPVLSATVGFNPTNSLIVQLSGKQYAIPVTFVGAPGTPAPAIVVNSLSGVTTFYNGVSVVGSLSGIDSNNWNSSYTTVKGSSASWANGFNAFTNLSANSSYWNSAYTTISANSAIWGNSFYATQAYTLQPVTSAINTVAGSNSARGLLSNIGGGSNNQALSAYDTVIGGYINIASGNYSNVAGGQNNISCGFISTVGGGWLNTSSGNYSTVIGGKSNCATTYAAVIGGGFGNNACGNASIVGGGSQNTASGVYSNIGGGYGNNSTGDFSFVAGGSQNNALGTYSSILGGHNNSISGSNSFAIGSSIVSNLSNYAFVNNLSSQGYVYAASASSNFLSVGAGTSLSNTIGQFFANNNSYEQVNIQNTNSGNSASTDLVITADNGNNQQNYVDLGINSSTNSDPAFSILNPSDAYLYTQSNNLAIGTAANANIVFHTGGTLASNERVRITSNGNVGIGTTSPLANLTVVGNISASGNLYYNNTVYGTGVATGSILPTRGNNTASGIYSVVGGGQNNSTIGDRSVVAGGCFNTASNTYASILGGCSNRANNVGAVVGGGKANTASYYGSTLGGSNNTACTYAFVGGGCTNIASGSASVVVGGYCNTNSGVYSSIVGGCCNTINNSTTNTGSISSSCYNFIAGGYNNTIAGGVSGVFVLGTNINATNSGYTYANNIITNGNICSNNIIVANLSASNNILVNAGLSAYCAVSRCSIVTGTSISNNAIVNGNQSVYGTLSSPNFAVFPGNRYASTLGNGTLSSFTVVHNLSTKSIFTTVIDNSTNQIVYPTITVPNLSSIQVGFAFIPAVNAYSVAIVGF